MACCNHSGANCACLGVITSTTATGLAAWLPEPVVMRGGLVDPSIFTDDQLRAELQRRRPGRSFAPIGSTVNISDFDDDALRAECERRWGLNAGPYRELAAERDEWKRRAEAAEAVITRQTRPGTIGEVWARYERGEIDTAEMLAKTGAPNLWGYRSWRSEQKPACSAEQSLRSMMFSQETRPGIAATKPDNSIAHLDEDLLCEDA